MSPSLNAPHPPDPSSRSGRHQEAAAAKPLSAALDRVGVAIVDDDENFHVMVRDILDREQQFQWIGSYFSGEAALAGIPRSGAQVVLMDIKMPGMSGIECARRLKALFPHLIIVMVTGVDDRRTIDLAKECANNFLLKPFSPGQFVATLSFCVPRPRGEITKPQLAGKATGQRGLRGRPLTTREIRLLEYMAEGLPYKEIAEETGVSKSAVHGMRDRIFRKLGVTNKVEAIRKWRNGNRSSP